MLINPYRYVVAGGGGGGLITALGKTYVTESPAGTFTKDSGGGTAWNAGFYSQEQVASGFGKISITMNSPITNDTFIIGFNTLAAASADANYTSIKFGLFPYAGSIYVCESGSTNGAFGSYVAGDILSIEITAGGSVIYRKNGTSFRSITPTLAYPYCVDCSIQNAGNVVKAVTLS